MRHASSSSGGNGCFENATCGVGSFARSRPRSPPCLAPSSRRGACGFLALSYGRGFTKIPIWIWRSRESRLSNGRTPGIVPSPWPSQWRWRASGNAIQLPFLERRSPSSPLTCTHTTRADAGRAQRAATREVLRPGCFPNAVARSQTLSRSTSAPEPPFPNTGRTRARSQRAAGSASRIFFTRARWARSRDHSDGSLRSCST